VLPETTDARDYLGSFVSLKDGTWIKLGIAIILAGQSMVWGLAVNLSDIAPFSPVYWTLHAILAGSAWVVLLMLGSGLIKEFVSGIRHFQLGIESLFMLSLLGALGGSVYATLQGSGDVYYEVIIVVLVIFSFGRKVGQVSKERAMVEVNRYREQFDTVSRITPDNSSEKIPYCELNNGDRFEVLPGSAISADGRIESGNGFVRETALTGEPHPMVKQAGDRLRAGTFSVDGTFTCIADEVHEKRLIDEILGNVEASIANTRSKRQLQAAEWIRYFVVIVSLIALATGLFWGNREGLSVGWLNSMSVLLIACPCALGLATPLAIWTSLWQLTSMGIVSRANYFMDTLANTRHVFFDKTGTLTQSSLSIGTVTIGENCPWTRDQLLAIAARLENSIEHPIARAFENLEARSTNENWPDGLSIVSKQWIPGKGIEAEVEWNGKSEIIRMGTPAWVNSSANSQEKLNAPHSRKSISMALGAQPIAGIELVEDLRPGVTALINQLKSLGIRSTVLTGDPFPQWKQIAGASVRENLTPADKEKIVSHSLEKGEHPLFVGDGINDLDAMLTAEASIAIHEGGASLTQSNASAILTGNQLEPIANAVRLARRIDQTLATNIKIAVVYNAVGISMAAAGLLHPVASVLIMIVSSLLVTFRAIRKSEAIMSKA